MGKNKVDDVWGTFSDLMRNYPLWPSTFSTCICGRGDGRGGGPCGECLKEELAGKIGPEFAEKAQRALINVQDVWGEIVDKCKCKCEGGQE